MISLMIVRPVSERRLISIRCQKECVESKLDDRRTHEVIIYMWVVQNFDIKSLKYCCY